MGKLTVDTITYNDGHTALTGATGQTGGAKTLKVAATTRGMSIGGTMDVHVTGASWTAKVTSGDGNFTRPITLTVTVTDDEGNAASQTNTVSENGTVTVED